MTRCRDIRQHKQAGRSVADVVLNPETTRTRRTSVIASAARGAITIFRGGSAAFTAQGL